MGTVDKYEDMIDSRDIEERISELEAMASPCNQCGGNLPVDGAPPCEQCLGTLEQSTRDIGENDELAALLALRDEAEGYSADWKYGSTLIRDSYFEDYAQQLAEDIGAIDASAKWPMSCIDWKQAARELQMDYTSVEFDGVTYWVR